MDMRSIMEEVPLSPPSKNNDVNNSFSSPNLRLRLSPLGKSNVAISSGDIDDDDDTKAAAIDNKQTIKCIFNKKKIFALTSFIAVLIIIATVAMSNNGSKENRPAVNGSIGGSNNAVSIPSKEGTDAPDVAVTNMAVDETNDKSLTIASSTNHHAKSAKDSKISGKASKKDGHVNGTKSSKSASPKRDSEWLSNLPTTGQCNSGTSFGCGAASNNALQWGYYLTCFDNPKNYEFITSIRFWTESAYGVGPGVGARVSFYYGSKDGGPITSVGGQLLPIPYSFSTLDVPATSDPQTTFKPGENNFTFPGFGVPAKGLDGFCIGLTPAFRFPSPLRQFQPVIRGQAYCPDVDLSVLTSGPSEGSYLNCNKGFEGSTTQNPAAGFSFNGDIPNGGVPGFCIEAEVAASPFKATLNIQYGIASGESLLLDKYEPTFETPGLKPIAIFVHGGGCSRGSKGEQAYVDLATNFASNGFVALSVDYRLRSSLPSCRTPGSIDAAGSDIKASIRYAKAMSHEWGVDPTNIWLYGCSAGARASAWATYVPGNGIAKTDVTVDTSQNNPEFDADVKALFMLSGELYVPHLECDLYACFNDDPRCIEPNEFVVVSGGPSPGFDTSSRCNYEVDNRFNPPNSLCDIQRSFGCENVVSKGDTQLTMLHNDPDNLVGTFTTWQVALRLKDLAMRKGVPVDLVRNNGAGHCSPSPGVPGSAISIKELLSRARTSLYGSGSKSGKSAGAH